MHTAVEQNRTPQLETPKRYQCRHIFTDGHRCGSPCLRSESLCYYHHTTRRPAPNLRARHSRRSTFELPLPEDRSAIQHSIGQVLQRIAANDIDPRRAGLLLYGLQIASLNLPKQPIAKSQPETVEEITTDPELGLLAPPAEVGHPTRRKSPIAQLLEKMLEDEATAKQSATQQSPAQPDILPTQPDILPTLQATAADSRPPNSEIHHLTQKNRSHPQPRCRNSKRAHLSRNADPSPRQARVLIKELTGCGTTCKGQFRNQFMRVNVDLCRYSCFQRLEAHLRDHPKRFAANPPGRRNCCS